MARSAATPHPLTRGTAFVLIVAAHICGIVLLTLGRPPIAVAGDDRTLSVFDVPPPPPPPPIDPPPRPNQRPWT